MLGKTLKGLGAITGTFTLAAIATGGLALLPAAGMLATDAALVGAGHLISKAEDSPGPVAA